MELSRGDGSRIAAEVAGEQGGRPPAGYPAPTAALNQPGMREAFLAGYTEAFRCGSRGVAQDLRVLMRPWGFELGSITVPAPVHHGDADKTVPVSPSSSMRPDTRATEIAIREVRRAGSAG